MLSSCDFVQCNNILNARGLMLDEVLSQEGGATVARYRQPLVRKDSYHPAISVTFDVSIVLQPKNADSIASNANSTTDWDFSKGNFFLLYSLLSELDWSDLHEFDDVDGAVEYFYDRVYSCINSRVPKKKHRTSCIKYPVWFNRELISNIQLKHCLHRR